MSDSHHIALKLKIEDISQIVFSGGGVRGIAYAGVFRSLSERNILPKINKVAGTSAGSIAALLLALNYPGDEITTLLETLDVSIFRDDPILGKAQLAYNLVEYLGFYSGNTLLDYIRNKIKIKTNLDPDVTLAEFDTYAKTNPDFIYREFSCIATHKNTGMPRILSAKTFPDMPLALAVRISCSIPFYFQPVMWPVGSGDYWEDGGMVDNYDLNLWDTKIDDDEDIRYIPNMHTLGFRLFLPSDKRDANFHYREFEVINLYDSVVAFVNTLLDQIDRMGIREEFWERTVSIPTGNVSAVDFDLTQADKDFLVLSGYESTEKFLKAIE